MDDKYILWLINHDDIIEVGDNFSREDMPEDSAFGILYDGETLVLDLNELNNPINMEYFIKLWNALYPTTPLTINQIIFEYDGEYHKFEKDTDKGDAGKVSMAIGIPSENTLVQTGNLGESLVSLIPGMQVLENIQGNSNHDVDFKIEFEGEQYGVEVKTNDRNGVDPYRYRMTGYGKFSLDAIRQAKTAYCEELGLIPATLGITVDFQNSTFDACMLRGEIRAFLGGANTLIAHTVPFENQGEVKPLGAETKLEARIPKPFIRPGETSQPAWKKKVIYRESPQPEDVF